jgi:hypothetical protein
MILLERYSVLGCDRQTDLVEIGDEVVIISELRDGLRERPTSPSIGHDDRISGLRDSTLRLAIAIRLQSHTTISPTLVESSLRRSADLAIGSDTESTDIQTHFKTSLIKNHTVIVISTIDMIEGIASQTSLMQKRYK